MNESAARRENEAPLEEGKGTRRPFTA
jgi:hypothetical protein